MKDRRLGEATKYQVPRRKDTELKYSTSIPFCRLEDLKQNLGIPLPASTQWKIVKEAAELIKPARDELIRQAAQGEVLHNDDTNMRVLALRRASRGGRRTQRHLYFRRGVDGRRARLLYSSPATNMQEGTQQRWRTAELPVAIQMSRSS